MWYNGGMRQTPIQRGALVKAQWPEALILWRKVFGSSGSVNVGSCGYRIVGHWDRNAVGILLGYRADEDKTMDVVLYKGEELWCDTDSLLEVSDG